MITVSLKPYAPIISDDSVGQRILSDIKDALNEDSVIIDMDGIVSMATYCAKQIFGNLYVSLGASNFFDKIRIANASDDLKVIIRMGIAATINDRDD